MSATYEVLEPGGHARLVGNVLDRIGRASANPASAVGSAAAMLGDAETASWMERTTAADGAALVESVKGNTLRWNQMVSLTAGSHTSFGVTITRTVDGTITYSGTVDWQEGQTSYTEVYAGDATLVSNIVAGHKYLIRVNDSHKATGSNDRYLYVVTNQPYTEVGGGNAAIFTCTTNATYFFVRLAISIHDGETISGTGSVNVFDLTAMFGAGNEPSSVAEFEALFPEPYYPYDPGSLLPVRMEGVETVGFNQWDEVWESGDINATTGNNSVNSDIWRSTNYIPVFPSTTYYVTGTAVGSTNGNIRGRFYTADKTYIGDADANGASLRVNRTFVTPSNARYMRFAPQLNNVVDKRICINISDPARNGTYEPYRKSERTIPAATYFPQGMRSAGTVRDELRADAAITRVGERAYQSGDESDTSVVTDGTVTHYALATPTTTPIDPPLPLSYRTGAGGTERVMVASGTTSAPPIFATRYPLDPADLAASIAPVDGPIAKTNHQVGDLLMLGFTLCKATQVIVTGETIEIGTNVTQTSVAAELAALSQ